MTPHDEPFDVGLSDADARLIELMKTQMEPPPLSEGTLRLLRTGDIDRPMPRPWIMRASMPWAAGTLAVSLALLLWISPVGQGTTSTSEALSFGTEGGWNYELFAPSEFDEFSHAYNDEMLLPAEYVALANWLD